MNILVPDSWLREFLETSATPQQIREYLSLCGPSVERIHEESGNPIYEIEITTNRPDAMSIVGVAREAAAILPQFGIAAKCINDPYVQKVTPFQAKNISKKLTIHTDPILNPRWTSIVFEHVTVKPSPDWLKMKLESTGIRSLNNIIDITNYLMRAYGQPAHAFDFDVISDKPNHATMILRASKKGEKLVTLDGKSHTLPGDDIVIEDGKGRLIDLCGIMGAKNSAIKETTKTVILFLQMYDPMHIRRTMMYLAHRSEAGGLFEKGIDPELVLPAFSRGVERIAELSGGKIASTLYDLYPKKYKPYLVSCAQVKADRYIGKHLTDKEITEILTPLGFQTKVTKEIISVSVPSFRRDVTIDVDIIEELARLHGYHNIPSTLPDTAPPVVVKDSQLAWEEEVKVRLRDWGFTETYTYSMISEELMDLFNLDKTKSYKITNPLSTDWVYMRPTLWPSMVMAIKQNLNIRKSFKLFELSMVYQFQENDLPKEAPVLIVAWTGHKFLEAKGLAQAIFALFGIKLPEQTESNNQPTLHNWDDKLRMLLGYYGSMSEVNTELLTKLGIDEPVTIFWVHFDELVKHAQPIRSYQPIPKYPSSFEDLAFIVPYKTPVGPMITLMKNVDPLIADVQLLDSYKDTRTFHITYLSTIKNLTADDIRPIREKIIATIESTFSVILKNI